MVVYPMEHIAKITVHWLDHSRAQRVLWLLEELDLPYEIKRYHRNPKTMSAPAELGKIHPLAKSPVITIAESDGKTTTIAESGAICEYLLERYGRGKFAPETWADPQDRADYLHWIHFAEGSIMGPLQMRMYLNIFPSPAKGPSLQDIIVTPSVKKYLSFVEDHLSKTPYFAGNELTGGDFMMVFPIEWIGSAIGFAEYPNMEKWFKKVTSRPAYIIAEEKGGKNDLSMFSGKKKSKKPKESKL